MAVISNEKIAEIVSTYAELGTYAATARKVKVTAATVKKYVLLNMKQPIALPHYLTTKFSKDELPKEVVLFPLEDCLILSKKEKEKLGMK